MKHSVFPFLNRRRLLQGVAGIVATAGLSACTRLLSETAAIGTDVTVKTDLSTGPHERHVLDLYVPNTRTKDTPLVMFLYGGSWKWGSKERYGFVGYSLAGLGADRGIATAIVDYRLHPEVRFPTFNEDAARAAAWLQANRQDFGLAPGPLHLMGHSAGAHIAALLAMDRTYLEAVGFGRMDIGRVVGLSGPYGMRPSEVNFIKDVFSPATDDRTKPLAFARSDAPPILMLHGADDTLVPPRHATEMQAALISKGVAPEDAQVKIYDGLGHKEVVLALTNPFQGLAPVLDDAVAFLRR